eukprot:Rhum_TRINITY_DN14725_c2_g1::Rhum_TRINITY_DN14725_c2_g1_i2::g.113452::m.113452
MLRTVAVLGFVLAAHAAETCETLACPTGSRCVTTDGVSFCDKDDIVVAPPSSNATKVPAPTDPCAQLVCSTGSFCAVAESGDAYCKEFEVISVAKNETASFGHVDTSAPADEDTPIDASTPVDVDAPRDADTPTDLESPADVDAPNDADVSLDAPEDAPADVEAPADAPSDAAPADGPDDHAEPADASSPVDATDAESPVDAATPVDDVDGSSDAAPSVSRRHSASRSRSSSISRGQSASVSRGHKSTTDDEFVNELLWCMSVTERTVAERRGCCKYGFGCGADPVDCTSAIDAWSGEQRNICCRDTRDGRGCVDECPMVRGAQEATNDYCCEVRGACGADYFNHHAEADKAVRAEKSLAAHAEVLTKMTNERVAVRDLLASPKAVLRRVRMMLLAASEELKQDPSLLTVTKIGLLENGAVPAAEKEQALTVPVPEAWNSALLPEEEELCQNGWMVTARGVSTLAGTTKEFVFAEYVVTGKDQSKVDKAVKDVDSTLGATALPHTAAPKASGGHSSGVLIGLGAALGSLCLGGLVAFTVYRRRQTADMLQLDDDEAVDVDVWHQNFGSAQYVKVAE